MVDFEGNIVMEYSYDPWGNIEYHFNEEVTTEEEAVIYTALCPLTYRGYNYDFTTGLYYLQSRYYNPEWGRFLNCDDTAILLATQGETHNANLFAYCANNPVNMVDYDGRLALDIPNKTVYVSIYGGTLGHAEITIASLVFSYGAYAWEADWEFALDEYVNNESLVGKGLNAIRAAYRKLEQGADSISGTQGVLIVAYDADLFHHQDKVTKERDRKDYSISVTDTEFINLLIFYCSMVLQSNEFVNKKWNSYTEKSEITEDNDYDWTWCYINQGKYATYKVFETNCATVVEDAIEFAMPNRYKKAKPLIPIVMPWQLEDLVTSL